MSLRGVCVAWLVCFSSCLCAGLATDTDGPDAALEGDAGADDAGVSDAGAADAGELDAGAHDAGVDAGPTHLDFDAGPPDLRCLADAGLTALEQAILSMPADSWLELKGTSFSTFCHAHADPSVREIVGCDAVVMAWSGAIFDDANHQLVVFGGGHGDYAGNEVYAFPLATQQWTLLHAATPLDAGQAPSEPMADGTPVSRHTYSGLAYLSDARAMLTFGGASAPLGSSVDTVWTFDLSSHTWARHANGPTTGSGHFYQATAYDPSTHHLTMRDEVGLWDYDAVADTWKHLIDFGYPPWYPSYQTYSYRSATLVPPHHLFVAAGGGLSDGGADLLAYDLDTKQASPLGSSGDLSVVRSPGPGLAYDPKLDALVAWADGAPGVMPMSTLVWQRGASLGAPARDPQVSGGTFGRFRYVAYLNAYLLVNSSGGNVFIYKLTSGC